MNRFVVSRLIRSNYSIAFRAALPASSSSSRHVSSLVSGFDATIAALPMREAVRYKDKNIKWTSSEFQVTTNPLLYTRPHICLTFFADSSFIALIFMYELC